SSLAQTCLPSITSLTRKHTVTIHIYTLSLHDALPISSRPAWRAVDRPAHRSSPQWAVSGQPAPALLDQVAWCRRRSPGHAAGRRDRKSTRLNSSHVKISYAVFCLKKKKDCN